MRSERRKPNLRRKREMKMERDVEYECAENDPALEYERAQYERAVEHKRAEFEYYRAKYEREYYERERATQEEEIET